jgi:hypothetical protein
MITLVWLGGCQQADSGYVSWVTEISRQARQPYGDLCGMRRSGA